ncbi:MAG: hypothetical protein A3J38_04430 [Gammaproteobacteria bacterium RIFCSPHIGHO2_12_FULL_45_9]|nr:MAG: hypothetical protein A3J38_04430 [Gammaproteobacteria bacterium RIFCSPHIGHO2_12_FULL_45_9]
MRKTVIWFVSLSTLLMITLSYAFLDQPLSDFLFAHHVRTHLIPFKQAVEWPPIMSGLAPLLCVFMLGLLVRQKADAPRWVQMCFIMAISLMLTFLLKNELKWVFSRYWPETWTHHNLSWIQDRAYGFQWFQGKLFQGNDTTGSFPSGHATAAFTIFWSIGLWYRRWLPLCLAVASLEGLAMVLFNYHFLSDVLAGAGLGTLCTVLCHQTFRALVREHENLIP